MRMMEIVNYATWDNPFTMFEIMGFGKADTAQSLLLAPGSTTMAWGPVVALVAKSLGLELDEITEAHEVLLADEDVTIASGVVEAGTISGMRFEIKGIVDGEERVVVEHVTRLRDDDAPHWPQGEGYRILVGGRAQPEAGGQPVLGPRRPQPRRLPGHRHARGQRHPRRGRRRPRRPHPPRPHPPLPVLIHPLADTRPTFDGTPS